MARIPILTAEEIKKMRIAGKLAARLLDYIAPFVVEGVSTAKLDQLCHEFIIEHGAIPAPLNYRGFPKSICTSINDVICHGIPSETEILKNGDVINVDVTVIKDGYHGDTSRMFLIGEVADDTKLLVERTKKAMEKGIAVVKPGARFNDIGKAIEKYISKFDYGIVQDFTGHGVGKRFHEEPAIFHYDTGRAGARMEVGMCFTIEPMINASSNWREVTDSADGWTARTVDGAISAQFEHTILVTPNGFEILTQA